MRNILNTTFADILPRSRSIRRRKKRLSRNKRLEKSIEVKAFRARDRAKRARLEALYKLILQHKKWDSLSKKQKRVLFGKRKR